MEYFVKKAANLSTPEDDIMSKMLCNENIKPLLRGIADSYCFCKSGKKGEAKQKIAKTLQFLFDSEDISQETKNQLIFHDKKAKSLKSLMQNNNTEAFAILLRNIIKAGATDFTNRWVENDPCNGIRDEINRLFIYNEEISGEIMLKAIEVISEDEKIRDNFIYLFLNKGFYAKEAFIRKYFSPNEIKNVLLNKDFKFSIFHAPNTKKTAINLAINCEEIDNKSSIELLKRFAPEMKHEIAYLESISSEEE